MIVDSKRGLAAVHHSNMESTYFELSKQELAAIQQMNDSDEDYESLWKTFVQSISIKERENLKLQRNMLPLYFRPFMTEFQEQIK